MKSQEKPFNKHHHSTRPGSKDTPINANKEVQDYNRVNYILITTHQDDQRIDNFLLSRLKGLPKSHLYKMIRADEVRINGKRCKPHDKIYTEDVVRLAPVKIATREKPVIGEEFANSLLERIVYEDDGLIVLNKPSGMAVHGGSGENFGVIEAMREVTDKKYLELVHRIDKDTSGLLMISKKRSALKKLQQHLRDKTIQKTYLAVVNGHVKKEEQLIDEPLLKFIAPNGERRVKVNKNDEKSKQSQTKVKVITRFAHNDKPVTLIQAMPLTGRTHQIRVHLTKIGHPLLGDNKYNIGDTADVRRLCLHAWKLEIPEYPVISIGLPEDISSLLSSIPAEFLAVTADVDIDVDVNTQISDDTE